MSELMGLRKTRRSDLATNSSKRLSSSNGGGGGGNDGLDAASGAGSTGSLGTTPGTTKARQSRSFSSSNSSAAPVRRVTSAASLRHENTASRQLEKWPSIGSVRAGSAAATAEEMEPRHMRTSHSKTNLTAAMAQQASLPSMPTASSVARDHFTKELEIHQHSSSLSQTLVVLQDACYGHRFSRPRSTQQTLDYIFERPERLRATALGIATAYVRMGGRSSAGEYQPSLDSDVSAIPSSPFMFRRTTRIVPLSSAAVVHVHGKKWMSELKTMCDSAEARLSSNGSELIRPSSAASAKSDRTSNSHTAPLPLNEGDLYLCPESLNALEGALGGVCEGIDAVFSPETAIRRAFVPIRPPGHHCSSHHPSGFCWLNNAHVGIAHAAMNHGLTHAAILDFDLHHGDGSQELAWQQNRAAVRATKKDAAEQKTKIGYFSLHDINSFPCEEGDFEKVCSASTCLEAAHGQSIWNVHLQPFSTPSEFWELYRSKYLVLLERARQFLKAHTEYLRSNRDLAHPKAAIFISAGFDGSEYEGAGMQRHTVNVPTDFYAQFTSDIVKLAEEEGLGVEGRVISILEGGYSDRALTTGVTSHLCGLCGGDNITGRQSEFTADTDASQATQNGYDTQWWSPANINELEAAVGSPETKIRPILKLQKAPPTYFSPTRASVAKATVQPPRDLKSSSKPQVIDITPMPSLRVDWPTASSELSKILVPSDRPTRSLEVNDLKVVAHKEVPTVSTDNVTNNAAGSHMQLRERRPKSLNKPPPLRSVKSRPNLVTQRDSAASPTTLASESPPLSPPLRPGSGALSANTKEAPKTRSTTVQRKSSKEQTLRTSASRAQLRPNASNRRPSTATDVDSLTSGVRKLKLIVPTREEYATREAAKEANNPQKADESVSVSAPIADDAGSGEDKTKERPLTPGKSQLQAPEMTDASRPPNNNTQNGSTGIQPPSSSTKSSSPSPPDKQTKRQSWKPTHQTTRRNDLPGVQTRAQPPSASPSVSCSGTLASSSSKRLSTTSTSASPPLSPHPSANGIHTRRDSQA